MHIFISHYLKDMHQDPEWDEEPYLCNMGSAHCGNIDDPKWIEFLHIALDEWVEAARKYGQHFTEDNEIVIQICNIHPEEE